ncbi:MAG TPA: NAD(P)H-hydrate dehydratase [Clostridiales bacterium]|nr:NAD(P)H-hydrate dehydratase [Clostridiales bacterium]
MKVLNCAQSRELEKRAVASGISYLQLMENAGNAAAQFLKKQFQFSNKHVVILCGKGNNGGDGYVVARSLSEAGALVVVVLVQGLPATEISRTMFERLQQTNVKTVFYEELPEQVEQMVSSADFIIDAIYGTGFHGSAPENMTSLFHAAAQAGGILVSLDIPSGANCDTGAVEGACMAADYTVSFSTLKNGHLLEPARSFCGRVAVLPIGIDSHLIETQESTLEVTEWKHAKSIIRPRNPESNKGNYGRLLCVCGSEGMAGAAVMSAGAAVRCGAGIVDIALPRSIYGIVGSRLAEPVYTLLDRTESGTITETSREALLQSLGKASACLLGCGLGQSSFALDLLMEVLAHSKIPLIIDADGINLLAQHINRLKTAEVPVILTPHPGEMARLLKTTVRDVQAHRLEYAQKFAFTYGVTLVLKGAGTIIAGPSGAAYLNPTGNAGMAKGGSGDVLAGMIASFVAQGIEPYQAAVGAVYLHGEAGDRCAKEFSQRAMLPTDLIQMLPKLFLKIERENTAEPLTR